MTWRQAFDVEDENRIKVFEKIRALRRSRGVARWAIEAYIVALDEVKFDSSKYVALSDSELYGDLDMFAISRSSWMLLNRHLKRLP